MSDPTKRPAFQWYPGDFRRDTAVQSCSFEARALWREMIDLMHDGEPYGHLTAGGVPIALDQLARIVGVPVAKARRWLAELEARKVFSRDAAGVIYSRRMVRDEQLRQVRREAGKLGGNPALLDKQTGKPPHNDPPKQRRNQTAPPAVAVASAPAVGDRQPASGAPSAVAGVVFGRPDAPNEYAIGLATAANSAITGRFGEQMHPLRWQRAIDLAEALMREGVELSVARASIAAQVPRASECPKGFGYFAEGIRRHWAEELQRRLDAASTPVAANHAPGVRVVGDGPRAGRGRPSGPPQRYDYSNATTRVEDVKWQD